MNLALLLHLYQPPTQSEASFKAITQECYSPLFRLLKSYSDIKVTVNLPLSILEQFDLYGYQDILNLIKDLVSSDRLEITGTAAYHPLLTKTPTEYGTRQIILNEYGLGYYFGQRQGFEGEISVVAKDIKGFFPPEMAFSSNLLAQLEDLGYDWVAVDEAAISEEVSTSIVYKTSKSPVSLMVRNRAVSDMLSFKRDGDASDIFDYLKSLEAQGVECLLVALDGEVFGHHNKEGIYLLGNLLDRMIKNNITLTGVSDLISVCPAANIPSIKESTWSTLRKGEKADNVDKIYPFWLSKKNTIQQNLWELYATVCEAFNNVSVPEISSGYENIAFWKKSELNHLEATSNKEIRDFIELEVLVYKALHSDQFWWASSQTVYDKVLFSKTLLFNALGIYERIAQFTSMASVKDHILSLISATKEEIASANN